MNHADGAHFDTMLKRAAEGDASAARELFPIVYAELRRLAAVRLAAMTPGQTLQATALVHEAYMRMIRNTDPAWAGRAHFFGAAANAMRNILVDHARARGRIKRGGGAERVELDEAAVSWEEESRKTLEIDRVIDRLAATDERKAQIVKLRFFVGMTHEQIAEVMGVTVRTIERDWRFARAWLAKELASPESPQDRRDENRQGGN